MIEETHLQEELLVLIRLVHSHMLNPHEVLPCWDLCGQPERELALAPDEPLFVVSIVVGCDAELENFEPGTRAIILRDLAGSFGEVHLSVLSSQSLSFSSRFGDSRASAIARGTDSEGAGMSNSSV